MVRVELEPGLTAYRCPVSGGHWVPYQNYWRWLAGQPGRLEHLPAPEGAPEPEDDRVAQVKICPETGMLMTRYRVGHGFAFSVDRSPAGIWFDAHEWEALRARNFHDEVHLVMTAPWQNRLRQEAVETLVQEKREQVQPGGPPMFGRNLSGVAAREEAFRARFAMVLDEGTLSRAEEFRAWLEEHPQRREILTYVMHDLRRAGAVA